MVPCFILIGIGLLTVSLSIPILLGKVKRNTCYGFRTRLTLSSDEVWYPANRFAARAMLVWSVFAIFLGAVSLPFLPFSTAYEIFLMAFPLTLLIPCAVAMRWTAKRFG